MNIEPDTHILESLRAERPRWELLFAEAVDNSFDALAKTIHINFGKSAAVIKDDGIGVTRDRISGVVGLGHHRPMNSTALGRYGVGIKFQSLSAGDIFEIVSVSRDGRVELAFNWQQIIDSRKWVIADPLWLKDTGMKTGTLITIRNYRATPPRATRGIVDELQTRFYPALASGLVISLNGVRLDAPHDPELTHQVDAILQFGDGKQARVRGGLLVDQKSPLRAVHVSYKHRVIMPRCGFGCGGVTGPMFARVELFGDWKLSKFKDDLIDPLRDELDLALQAALAGVLQKCQSVGMNARVDEIVKDLNAMLPPELTPARPEKKTQQERKGAKRGDKKAGTSKSAREQKTGPIKKPVAGNEVRIAFDDAVDEPYGIGYLDKRSRPRRIVLGRDNGRISALLKAGDRKALLDLALCIYAHESGDDLFAGFGKKAAELIARQPS